MDESAPKEDQPPGETPPAETPAVDAARLLKILEVQSAAQRERRQATPGAFQGIPFRYGSLVVIVVFALGSVAIMEWVVSQLPRPHGPAAGAPEEQAAPARIVHSTPSPAGKASPQG